MNTLLDIIKGIIYLTVSLTIIIVLGVIYVGFVTLLLIKEILLYIKSRLL